MRTLKISNKKCILIGEGSIARFCLELLQKKHFEISALISGDPLLTHWAASQNIRTITWYGQDKDLIKDIDTEYSLVISAGNLHKVPEQVLSFNNCIALNIHDGPMNHYLGFNTPAWALIDQQQSHQVNWHLMTSDLYHGEVISSCPISIDPDETAMTLNAKCFTAALNSLDQLLDDLETGIALKDQLSITDEQQHIFKRQQKPLDYGFLNPHNGVESNIAITRGLDFGHHQNPLCLAKAWIDNNAYHVINARHISDEINNSIGAIIGCVNSLIQVQCIDGVLEVELAALSILRPELQLTQSPLQSLSLPYPEQLAAISQHFGQHEFYWQEKLSRFSALSIPYIDAQLLSQPQFQSQSLQLEGDLSKQVMLVAAYFSRLCDQALFSTPLILDENYAGPTDIASALDVLGSARQAFSHEFTFEETLEAQLVTFTELWQQLLSAGNFSADFVKRSPELHQWQAAVDQPYAMFISDESDETLKQKFKCFNAQSLGIVVSPRSSSIRLISNGSIIKSLAQIAHEIEHLAIQAQQYAELTLGELSLVTPEEQALLLDWSVGPEVAINELLFDRLSQAIKSNPSKTAVSHRSHTLSYQDLQTQINQVKACLKDAGVKPGDFVGIMMPRALPLLPCLLGTMAYGAACVPMDPLYPQDRLDYVIENSQLKVILCLEPSQVSEQARQITWSEISQFAPLDENQPISASDLAYMLYTSGSSGKPKGVMVEHGNLANFFIAMDQKIPLDEKSVWLAVTSISFDISLLELLWTLTRGITVVLYDGQDIQTSKDTLETPTKTQDASDKKAMDFGLFFWNISNEHDQPGPHQYELLLKASEYGDKNGFSSVWTPERHFGDFGGLYPNPAITSAAVAARTENIHIRAGSCVFPLHHPVRVAEDWSMIDNISNGRVGLSAAPGWMPNDFVIMPENYSNAKDKMFENLETVRKLWRGDKVSFDGPKGTVEVTTLPRPVQKELPVWITTGGNPENFRIAGEMGVHLLTHLLGQTVEELTNKIKIYRDAWAKAGHPGEGTITVMLHTFVGETQEQAREIVREPMKNYLKTALFLVKAAAWDWPLFKKLSESQSQNLDEFFENISNEDMDALLDFAFERYFKTSGLFGNEQDCIAFAQKLYHIGVNEIGCLIDFGIGTETVLNHLPLLKNVLNHAQEKSLINADAIAAFGVAALIERHKVTHLQVTPSMARLFLSDPHIAAAMKNLQAMLVGGEALPLDLARTLKGIIQGPLLNMYGPTETTIWSSVSTMNTAPETISLGHAIANTQISIVDSRKQPMPIGAIGELFIGGAGVVRGYWQREDLTAEKFLTGYPAYSSCEKVYATGDLARYLPDGRLLFLGRNDFQVKVRGYRIELGEIETLLLKHPGIAEAVVHPVVYSGAEPRLVGYYTLKNSAEIQPINSNQLKQALAAELPSFMVPNVFVELSAFPLTPNAKIDRKALPLPKQTTEPVNSQENFENASDIELKVLEIWRDILGTDQFGLDDNFFDHGGHSLLVVDVMTRVRPLFEKQIKLIDLFRFPMVRKLVKHLSSESEASDTSVLSNAQSRGAARRAARRR